MHKIKSPIIYMGGKYDILEYIDALLPRDVAVFYDVFAGAFNVGGNMSCEKVVYNDKNYRMREFFELLRNTDPYMLDEKIRSRIKELGIIRYKHETYYKARDVYNNNQNPVDMFILHCYSFMHMLQYNSEGKMNCSCGDAEYNKFIRANLIGFGMKIRKKDIEFMSTDFHDVINKAMDSKTIGTDVLYCDPPYLISNGAYNKHASQWTEADDETLYKFLDAYADNGGLFILSNVMEHRKKTNLILKKFSERHCVYHVPDKNYRNLDNLMKTVNSTYDTDSDEVLVTNIKNPRNPDIFIKENEKRRNFW